MRRGSPVPGDEAEDVADRLAIFDREVVEDGGEDVGRERRGDARGTGWKLFSQAEFLETTPQARHGLHREQSVVVDEPFTRRAFAVWAGRGISAAKSVLRLGPGLSKVGTAVCREMATTVVPACCHLRLSPSTKDFEAPMDQRSSSSTVLARFASSTARQKAAPASGEHQGDLRIDLDGLQARGTRPPDPTPARRQRPVNIQEF